jgi:hypothetical protein
VSALSSTNRYLGLKKQAYLNTSIWRPLKPDDYRDKFGFWNSEMAMMDGDEFGFCNSEVAIMEMSFRVCNLVPKPDFEVRYATHGHAN